MAANKIKIQALRLQSLRPRKCDDPKNALVVLAIVGVWCVRPSRTQRHTLFFGEAAFRPWGFTRMFDCHEGSGVGQSFLKLAVRTNPRSPTRFHRKRFMFDECTAIGGRCGLTYRPQRM